MPETQASPKNRKAKFYEEVLNVRLKELIDGEKTKN